MDSSLSFNARLRAEHDAIFSKSQRGFLIKALVFQKLRESPIVRALPEASLDGAIYLPWYHRDSGGAAATHIPELYADRLLVVSGDHGLNCINFSISLNTLTETRNGIAVGLSWSHVHLSPSQVDHSAFIIVVFRANRGNPLEWAALVPTKFLHGNLLTNTIVDYHGALINTTADPSMHPFAFPFSMLPVAIDTVVESVLTRKPYRNPWSKVVLHNWMPQVKGHTFVTSGFRSSGSSRRSSVSEGAQHLRRAISRSRLPLRFEMNDIQPLMGEFLLIDLSTSTEYLFRHRCGDVQEIDHQVKIRLGTGSDGTKSNPFAVIWLWDFILLDEHIHGFAYCIPRQAVPLILCTSTKPYEVLLASQLQQWRLSMRRGDWLETMYKDIILQYSQPLTETLKQLDERIDQTSELRSRGPMEAKHPTQMVQQAGSNVVRNETAATEFPALVDVVEQSSVGNSTNTTYRNESVPVDHSQASEEREVQDSCESEDSNDFALADASAGGRLHSARGYGNHGLITLLQDECVRRREGLILPLSHFSAYGDYCFVLWSWTDAEAAEYLASRTLPFDLIDRNCDPDAMFCIPLVAVRLYSDEQGVKLCMPAPNTCKSQQTGSARSQNKHEAKHFLSRKAGYILLGDPCPSARSSGILARSHSCFLVASEHLRVPDGALYTHSPTPARQWMRNFAEPWDFCISHSEVHRVLVDILCSSSVIYNDGGSNVRTASYQTRLHDIWQAQADDIIQDAVLTLTPETLDQ